MVFFPLSDLFSNILLLLLQKIGFPLFMTNILLYMYIVGPPHLQIPYGQIIKDEMHFIRDLSTHGFSYV